MSTPIVNCFWAVRRQDTDAAADSNPFATFELATAAARAAAAAVPGTVWIVFQATHYAYTDLTPVNMLPVAAPVS